MLSQKFWITLGAIAGIVFVINSAFFQRFEHDLKAKGLSIQQFTSMISIGPAPAGHSRVIDVTVFPSLKGNNYVTGRRFIRLKGGEPVYEQFEFNAKSPLRIQQAIGGRNEFRDVRELLDVSASAGQHISYRYAWWRGPLCSIVLPGLCLALFIGGSLPYLLRMAARRRQDREASVAVAGDTRLLGADGKSLILGDSANQNASEHSSLPSSIPSELAIRQSLPLSQDTSDEQLLRGVVKDEESIVFQGEYYPVAKSTQSRDAED